MRRYAFDTKKRPLEEKQYDVVVVGAGLAGLYTAWLLDDRFSCALLVKGPLYSCNSSLAQGGIAAVMHPEDNTGQHIEDTLKAGCGLADEEGVRMMVEQGPGEISNLVSLGVVFDKEAGGSYHTTREGGHTRKRVLHCGGDATGDHLIQILADRVKEKKNVDILEDCFLADIVTGNADEVCGVIVFQQGYKAIVTSRVVIATGGIGQVYLHTTNQEGIAGDGIAAAIRTGARCSDMEFVQFHPTAFYNTKSGQSGFLVSEAVRGEGGILRNHRGEAFMEAHHPMKDLAPRDITARAIFLEMQASGENHVFLDITSRSADFLAARFPTIYKHCKAHGIDMATEKIPVAPVQHYFMGGIRTNLNGQSNIEGLYACGEAAGTSVHGANRLASNSLLECLVFSRQCATHINGRSPGKIAMPSIADLGNRVVPADIDDMRRQIKELMQQHGGIVRNEQGMTLALSAVKDIAAKMQHMVLQMPRHTEVYNMALIAIEILQAALRRKRSVGAHYREDSKDYRKDSENEP